MVLTTLLIALLISSLSGRTLLTLAITYRHIKPGYSQEGSEQPLYVRAGSETTSKVIIQVEVTLNPKPLNPKP